MSTIKNYLNTNSSDVLPLLAFVLKKSSAELYAHAAYCLSQREKEKLDTLISQRNKGVPLAYLTGFKYFYHLKFKINKHALIPREETELLIDIALDLYDKNSDIDMLELATGSGVIAITLSDIRRKWCIFATDNSAKALALAQENARCIISHNHYIRFYYGSWFEPLNTGMLFDLIIANPPYIAKNDIHLINLNYEPMHALVSDNYGLSALEHIIKYAPNFLKKGGYLLLEHGFSQRKRLLKMFEKRYQNIRTFNDLAQQNRVILAQTV